MYVCVCVCTYMYAHQERRNYHVAKKTLWLGQGRQEPSYILVHTLHVHTYIHAIYMYKDRFLSALYPLHLDQPQRVFSYMVVPLSAA